MMDNWEGGFLKICMDNEIWLYMFSKYVKDEDGNENDQNDEKSENESRNDNVEDEDGKKKDQEDEKNEDEPKSDEVKNEDSNENETRYFP